MLLGQMLERCAACYPDKAAYVCGDRRRTWNEIHERSDALARALQDLGARKGQAIGILGQEGLEIYEHLYACVKLGAVRVGLNWRYAPPELLHVLRDASVEILLVQARLMPVIQSLRADIDTLGIKVLGYGGHHDEALDYDVLIGKATGSQPDMPSVFPDDPMLYSYTSGATGNPKGVVISHRSAASSVLSAVVGRGLAHDDVYYVPPQSSWITVMMNLFGLANGMTHAIPDGVFEIGQCLRDIERFRATVVLLVPTMIKRAIKEYRAGTYDLSSLRMIMYGSSPASPELVRETYEVFGCELTQTYGMTETAGGVTHLSPGDHRSALASEPQLLSSVGRPSVMFSLSIRGEDGQPLAPGMAGEIWIKGGAVMTSYLNLPDQTVDVLRDGWLRTNDIGKFDARGYLYLIDRKQFQINTGAVKVFPAVVERVLLSHPAVDEACVLGAPHPEWGEAVVAIVTLKPGWQQPTQEEFKRFCVKSLSKPECPKAYIFTDDFARTSTGKVAKDSVKKWLLSNTNLLPWATSESD